MENQHSNFSELFKTSEQKIFKDLDLSTVDLKKSNFNSEHPIIQAMKEAVSSLPDLTEKDKFHNLDRYYMTYTVAMNKLLFNIISVAEGVKKPFKTSAKLAETIRQLEANDKSRLNTKEARENRNIILQYGAIINQAHDYLINHDTEYDTKFHNFWKLLTEQQTFAKMDDGQQEIVFRCVSVNSDYGEPKDIFKNGMNIGLINNAFNDYFLFNQPQVWNQFHNIRQKSFISGSYLKGNTSRRIEGAENIGLIATLLGKSSFIEDDFLRDIDLNIQYYMIICQESYSGSNFTNKDWTHQKMLLNVKPEQVLCAIDSRYKICINDTNEELFLENIHTIPKFIIENDINKALYEKYKDLIERQNETGPSSKKTDDELHKQRIEQWSGALKMVVERVQEVKEIESTALEDGTKYIKLDSIKKIDEILEILEGLSRDTCTIS